MAISSSAMTLAQSAVLSNDPLVRAVSFALIKNGNVLADIPMVNQSVLSANGVRFVDNLPTVSWVPLNTEGTNTTGTPTPFQEQAYLLRNYIDMDHVLLEQVNQIQDPRAVQIRAYLEAATYEFNFRFINNTHTGSGGDANAFIGIRQRIDDYANWGLRSTQKIDAGGAVFTQAMTALQANTMLEWLDQLLWTVNRPNGDGVIIYTNEVFLRRFMFALRLLGTSGGLSVTKDQFDRVIISYKGARFQDIGYKADQTTRIITTTEDTAGANGSSTYTSIYAVAYGEDSIHGWQYGPLKAKNMGLLENQVIYRIFAEWVGGLFGVSNKCVARLYDIKIS